MKYISQAVSVYDFFKHFKGQFKEKNDSPFPPKTFVASAVANRLTKHLTDLQIHNGPTMHSFRSGCSKPLSLLGMYYEWVAKHVGWKSLDTAIYYTQFE